MFLLLAVSLNSAAAAHSETIRIEGTTLYFTGKIEQHTADDLFEQIKGKSIRKLVVSSSGGEVMAAMDIGLWMFENSIDIEIDRMCFSSCANYLFTAANHKTIPPGSVVAWHGDLRQLDVTPEVLAEKIREVAEESSAEAVGHLVESMLIYHQDGIRKQDAFFEVIGVNPDICSIGVKYGAEDFFILSVADMASFGVDDIAAAADYLQTDLSEFNRYVPVAAVKLDAGLQPAD
ncbi:MAG: hypothetical protein KQH59_06925 [Desulfobulbaceae bacterium]|nr:hypothetical protein [Desulfobulbaceae bacterium]